MKKSTKIKEMIKGMLFNSNQTESTVTAGIDSSRVVIDEKWVVRKVVAELDLYVDKLLYYEHKPANYTIVKDLAKDAVTNLGHERIEIGEEWVVAGSGRLFNILANDESPIARSAIAKKGYGFDSLMDDESWTVRSVVAIKGLEPERLSNGFFLK